MVELQYTVVRRGGRWLLVGDRVPLAAYSSRNEAVSAARRLGKLSGGLPVTLLVQDDAGDVRAAERLASCA